MKNQPYTQLDNPFTPEEAHAICWCADEQVGLAIRHGTITRTQAEEHWYQVAQDLINDPDLLKMMVEGHGRSKRNKRITSTLIYQDYEQEHKGPALGRYHSPARIQHPTATAIAGAIMLAAASPLAPIFAHSAFASPGSSMSTSNGMPPFKREQELPPHRPPRVRHIVKKKKDEEGRTDGGMER